MLLLLEIYIYSRWILVLFMDLISYYYYYHSFLIVNDSFICRNHLLLSFSSYLVEI